MPKFKLYPHTHILEIWALSALLVALSVGNSYVICCMKVCSMCYSETSDGVLQLLYILKQSSLSFIFLFPAQQTISKTEN